MDYKKRENKIHLKYFLKVISIVSSNLTDSQKTIPKAITKQYIFIVFSMVALRKTVSSKTILIVDDKTNNLQLLLEYLDRANYEVLIATNGKKAIFIAKKEQPDLILLDVMMPNIDGFDVCSRLKSDASTKDIPIIFMTARTQTQDKIKGLRLGAADYITKPFSEEELLARLKIHLSLSQLYQSSVKDAQRSKLILEVSDRIRQSLDLKVIIAVAIAEIKNLIDCDFVAIASVKNQQVAIENYTASKDIKIESKAFIPYQYFCPSPDIYKSYLQGKVKFLENQNRSASLPDAQSRLLIPIAIENTDYKSSFFSFEQDKTIIRNTLYGWIIVDRNISNNPWKADEISLLKELAIHLAISIKQGLLHQELSELALLDSLTRVYNRRFFDRQLQREWKRLKRIPAALSLVMCDVDCFKIYNDVYGHQQGDKCLQQVATAISSVLKRPGDIITRYGGEEFMIILPHTPQTGAAVVAESMRKAVKSLEIAHNNSLVDSVVTVSLGVASTIPNTLDNPQLLIEAADLALYKSKDRGRDCVSVYPESISHSKDRKELELHWVKRLRKALEQNLFSLYAQSITPLKENDSRKSFEILLRLTDQGNEVTLPGVFLDIAEQNFLMTDIDIWVVNNLFDTLEKCDRALLNNCHFAVN